VFIVHCLSHTGWVIASEAKQSARLIANPVNVPSLRAKRSNLIDSLLPISVNPSPQRYDYFYSLQINSLNK